MDSLNIGDMFLTNDYCPSKVAIKRHIKRLEDITLALLLLVLISPCLLLIALLIKLDSSGPVLFSQRRRGEGNSIFLLYKFRSMFIEACDVDCATQAGRGDARITKVGSFLRRHSLDELPQLFNVLLGHMSLVGPRPHALGTNIGGIPLADISELYDIRCMVKPGLTGWAQVNQSRGILNTPEDLQCRIRYDLYYIANWSLGFDLMIMVMTLRCLTSDDAAY